jgi:hypothetical protein
MLASSFSASLQWRNTYALREGKSTRTPVRNASYPGAHAKRREGTLGRPGFESRREQARVAELKVISRPYESRAKNKSVLNSIRSNPLRPNKWFIWWYSDSLHTSEKNRSGTVEPMIPKLYPVLHVQAKYQGRKAYAQ